MMKDNEKEMFPLVLENGNIIGSISRNEAHDGTKRLHPVVHLHVFINPAKRNVTLLQNEM